MTILSSESEAAESITRREAVLRVTALLGGVALVGGSSLLTGCADRGASSTAAFSPDDVAFLDEVAETILPETKTPGAKAAKVGAFMALMVTDSYSTADQKIFRDGMHALEQASRKTNGVSFATATPQQRLALLQSLDQEQKTHSDAREAASRAAKRAGAAEPGTPAHYFRMMKELSLLGYFTSEIGCTKAQRYVEAPGRFDPCLPYTAGEPAQAGHA
jgi:hypothetical protein